MLEVLELNFNDQNKYLRKEVAWMIANILASGNKIIQRVLDHSIYNLMRSKSLHDDIIVISSLFNLYHIFLSFECYDEYIVF